MDFIRLSGDRYLSVSPAVMSAIKLLEASGFSVTLSRSTSRSLLTGKPLKAVKKG